MDYIYVCRDELIKSLKMEERDASVPLWLKGLSTFIESDYLGIFTTGACDFLAAIVPGPFDHALRIRAVVLSINVSLHAVFLVSFVSCCPFARLLPRVDVYFAFCDFQLRVAQSEFEDRSRIAHSCRTNAPRTSLIVIRSLCLRAASPLLPLFPRPRCLVIQSCERRLFPRMSPHYGAQFETAINPRRRP